MLNYGEYVYVWKDKSTLIMMNSNSVIPNPPVPSYDFDIWFHFSDFETENGSKTEIYNHLIKVDDFKFYIDLFLSKSGTQKYQRSTLNLKIRLKEVKGSMIHRYRSWLNTGANANAREMIADLIFSNNPRYKGNILGLTNRSVSSCETQALFSLLRPQHCGVLIPPVGREDFLSSKIDSLIHFMESIKLYAFSRVKTGGYSSGYAFRRYHLPDRIKLNLGLVDYTIIDCMKASNYINQDDEKQDIEDKEKLIIPQRRTEKEINFHLMSELLKCKNIQEAKALCSRKNKALISLYLSTGSTHNSKTLSIDEFDGLSMSKPIRFYLISKEGIYNLKETQKSNLKVVGSIMAPSLLKTKLRQLGIDDSISWLPEPVDGAGNPLKDPTILDAEDFNW